MKIYIDGELPKSCAECKILGVFDWCNYLKDCVSDEIKNNKRHILCPLTTTQSLKQQVREEVVEEIKEKFNDTIKHHFCPNPSSVDFITLCISEVEEFLDQVKRRKQ